MYNVVYMYACMYICKYHRFLSHVNVLPFTKIKQMEQEILPHDYMQIILTFLQKDMLLTLDN